MIFSVLLFGVGLIILYESGRAASNVDVLYRILYRFNEKDAYNLSVKMMDIYCNISIVGYMLLSASFFIMLWLFIKAGIAGVIPVG